MEARCAYQILFDAVAALYNGDASPEEIEIKFSDPAIARSITIQATADLRDGLVALMKLKKNIEMAKHLRHLFAILSKALDECGKSMEGVLAWEGVDLTTDFIEETAKNEENDVTLKLKPARRPEQTLMPLPEDVPKPFVNGSCCCCKERFRFSAFTLANNRSGTIKCPNCGYDFGTDNSKMLRNTAILAAIRYFNRCALEKAPRLSDPREPLPNKAVMNADEYSIGRPPRVLLKPTRADIAGISVFITHHSAQRDWAEDVGGRLMDYGFDVVMVPPMGSYADRSLTDQQIADLLETKVRESDYLIVLLSPTSVLRDWVRYELKLSARTKGRALYLYRPEDTAIPNFSLPGSDPLNEENPLLVKHTTLADRCDPHDTHLIASQLVTDPDEGFMFSTSGLISIEERDLKAEARLKHMVRDYVWRMPQYRERQLVNVYPCIWERMGIAEGEIDQAISWCRDKYGSLDLHRIGQDYGMSWIVIPIEAEDVSYYTEGDRLWALLVWRAWQ